MESIVQKVGLFELVQLPICVVVIATAFIWPRINSSGFRTLENGLKGISTQPYASALLIATIAILCRAALIPLIHVNPLIPDEISLRLQADTYLNGRISNPSIDSADFTSIYTLLKPSYASIYPALRSFPLALGRLIGLDFWFGAWLTAVALCIITYWALRAFVSPPYALIAALIAVARFAIFSPWVNSYFGAASTAIGGLLLIGGFARLVRKPTLSSGFFVGAGVFIVMVTRPFEGMMFSIPVAIGILAHFLKSREQRGPLIGPGLVAASLVLAGFAVSAVHNQAVTGDWRAAPYTFYQKVSGASPAFLFAPSPPPRAQPRYAPERDILAAETNDFARGKTLRGIASAEASRFEQYWNFYVGFALTLPFVIGLMCILTRLTLVLASAMLVAGLMVETFDWAQYASPAFGVVMVCIAMGLQRLRRYAPGGRPIGMSLSRLLPLGILVGSAVPLTSVISANANLELPSIGGSSCCWIPRESAHSAVQRALSRYDGRKFVVVDTGPTSPRMLFVVYNDADVVRSPIVWLNEDAQLNPHTFSRYPGRAIWHMGWTALGSVCLQLSARGFGPAMTELKTERYNGYWRRPSDKEVSEGCLRL